MFKHLIILFMCIMLVPVALKASYVVVDIQDTRDIMNTVLPTDNSTSSTQMVVVYQIRTYISSGITLSATAQMEVTNPSGSNVFGVGRGIAISTDPDAPIGTWISPPTMSNLTQPERHEVINLSGDYTVEHGGYYYVSLIGYAVNLTTSSPYALRVEPGYGFLNIKMFRSKRWPNGPLAPPVD